MEQERSVVVASGNAGKFKEIQAMLSYVDYQAIAQADLAIDDAEETGESFVENAILKARHAAS